VVEMSKEYITLNELANIFKISRATIDRWRKEGMPAHKVGRGVRFIESDVRQWIAINKSNTKSTSDGGQT
jgi:excisionase family DNA binding protein